MVLVSSLAFALLANPGYGLASPPVRSEDGSAELEALRELGTRDPLPVTEVEPGSEPGSGPGSDRGLEFEYGVPMEPGAVVEPTPGEPTIDDTSPDVLAGAEQALVLRRARRFKLAGFWLTFTGGLLGPALLAGAISGARNSPTPTAPIVLGSLSGVTFGLLAAGIPLIVRGVKMTKHPERYITLTTSGLTLRF